DSVRRSPDRLPNVPICHGAEQSLFLRCPYDSQHLCRRIPTFLSLTHSTPRLQAEFSPPLGFCNGNFHMSWHWLSATCGSATCDDSGRMQLLQRRGERVFVEQPF